MNRLLNLPSTFFVGCNYWASHAGAGMWSDWRPDQVAVDFQRLYDAGIDVLRVFPLWSEFQPIHALYSGGGVHAGVRFGEQHRPDDDAGRAGISTLHMQRFAELTQLAETHGLKLIVGLVTGWMSGRLFVPPALQGRNVITDPESIRWQVRFVSHVVKTMKNDPAIIAWDLGNECNVMGEVASSHEAYTWTAAIANAIKTQDSTRPLLSGMHSLTPTGTWTMQDQGELTDVLTTHPYPYWTPYLDFDPLTSMRPTLHATVESLFYADLGGKPCFAEEMGTMGPMISSEPVAAAFARTSLWSQWAQGLDGVLWWCASDQTRLQQAPYDWTACEGELGLITEDGRVKPALTEMTRVKQVIDGLPTLPPRVVDGVCILNSRQDHWAVALGSFLLAKQAGFDLAFSFEEQPIPDAGFYLLPSVTGSEGIPKRRWQELLRRVHDDGATLYVSLDDGYLLNFAELTGLTVQNRQRRTGPARIRVGDAPVQVPATFRLDYSVDRAEVLTTEEDGNPVLVTTTYGRGRVYFCALPIELVMATEPGISRAPDTHPLWRLYEAISTDQRATRALQVSSPELAVTEHLVGDDERIAVLVNHSPVTSTVTPRLQAGWAVDEALAGPAPGVDGLTVPANDALVLRLRRSAD